MCTCGNVCLRGVICGDMSEICISVGMCLWHVCLCYNTCQRVAGHGKCRKCWTQCSGYCHLWGVILIGTTIKYGEWMHPTLTLHCIHLIAKVHFRVHIGKILPCLVVTRTFEFGRCFLQFFLKPRKDPLAPPWLSTFPWPNSALCNLAPVVPPLFPFRGHSGSFLSFSLSAAFALVFGFQQKLKTHFGGK